MNLPLNIHTNSSDAMKTILDLHFPDGRILDVNHSWGVFYKNVERDVIGIDTRYVSNIVADNGFLPVKSDSFVVGVADPPYRRGNGDTKYEKRYGKAPYTSKRVTDQYKRLIPELVRVSTNGIVLKAQDETDGHKFYFRMAKIYSFMKDLYGLEPHDIAYVYRSNVMDNKVRGDRHFMANCVSYFLIYKWSQKNPFKPVRF